MNKFNLNELEASPSEWAQLVVGRERDLVIPENIHEKVYRTIRGKRCKDEDTLFQEWAAALQFPYYFGNNWDAFNECINDLSWLEGKSYTFVITNLDSILPDNNEAFKIFIELLRNAAKIWSEPVPKGSDWRWTRNPIPFHIVFHCESKNKNICEKLLEEAGIDVVTKEIPPFDKIS